MKFNRRHCIFIHDIDNNLVNVISVFPKRDIFGRYWEERRYEIILNKNRFHCNCESIVWNGNKFCFHIKELIKAIKNIEFQPKVKIEQSSMIGLSQ